MSNEDEKMPKDIIEEKADIFNLSNLHNSIDLVTDTNKI